jgi:hypothetical protein
MGYCGWWSVYPCVIQSSKNCHSDGIRQQCWTSSHRGSGSDGESVRCEHVQCCTYHALPSPRAMSCNFCTFSSLRPLHNETRMHLQPDETHIAVGMSDGTLSVRRRQPRASEASAAELDSASRSGALESLLGGTLPVMGTGSVRNKTKSKPIGDVDEFRVESRRTKRLKEYDRLLKGFKYSAALDSVLRKVKTNHLPSIFVSRPRSKYRRQRHFHSSRNSFIVMLFGVH